MFDCTIARKNDVDAFNKAVMLLDKAFPDAKKEKLLIDVDGTLLQIYHLSDGYIKVCDDYDVGAVFVESDHDLSSLFPMTAQ